MTEKEHRMYKRWKQYKISDLTAKEQKMFRRWENEMDGYTTTKKRKKKQMEYKPTKPAKRKGFWNKLEGAVMPNDEEQEYREHQKLKKLKTKLQTRTLQRDIAKAERQLGENKGRQRGSQMMEGMMGLGGSSRSTTKKKKPRRNRMNELVRF